MLQLSFFGSTTYWISYPLTTWRCCLGLGQSSKHLTSATVYIYCLNKMLFPCLCSHKSVWIREWIWYLLQAVIMDKTTCSQWTGRLKTPLLIWTFIYTLHQFKCSHILTTVKQQKLCWVAAFKEMKLHIIPTIFWNVLSTTVYDYNSLYNRL